MTRASMLVALVALGLSATGCDQTSGAAPQVDPVTGADTAPDGAEHTGMISFELRTEGGLRFDEFSYVITRPGFSRTGTIDVSDSSTVSAVIAGIPAGSGYSVSMQGSSIEPTRSVCSGSQSFEVQADVVSAIEVAIRCHEPDSVPVNPVPTPAPFPPAFGLLLGASLLALGSVRQASSRRR